MKKILFLSTLETLPWGGSEQLWSDMAVHALKEGNDVMACYLAWPDQHEKLQMIEALGGDVILRPNYHIGVNRVEWLANKLKGDNWRAKIEKFQPDVIVISQGGSFDNAMRQHGEWLMSLNIPYHIINNFCPEYCYLNEGYRSFFKELYDRAEGIYFVSERNKEVASRALAHTLHNASVIKSPIRNIDTPDGYPEETVYGFASVARLDVEVKGYDILIETFAQPLWRNRSFKLNIYGIGDSLPYLQALVAEKQLQDKVFFKGYSSSVAAIWNENHLLVMASRGEGTPLSLIEANLCERAAVVTNVGGCADVVEEGYNGFVAEAPVVCCFSNAMERAWENRDKWQQMGVNAKHKILQTHGQSSVKKIFDMILQTKPEAV